MFFSNMLALFPLSCIVIYNRIEFQVHIYVTEYITLQPLMNVVINHGGHFSR